MNDHFHVTLTKSSPVCSSLSNPSILAGLVHSPSVIRYFKLPATSKYKLNTKLIRLTS